MGIVFEAEDPERRKRVALKIVRDPEMWGARGLRPSGAPESRDPLDVARLSVASERIAVGAVPRRGTHLRGGDPPPAGVGGGAARPPSIAPGDQERRPYSARRTFSFVAISGFPIFSANSFVQVSKYAKSSRRPWRIKMRRMSAMSNSRRATSL